MRFARGDKTWCTSGGDLIHRSGASVTPFPEATGILTSR